MKQTDSHIFFKEKLMAWYDPDQRPMPWKSEKDPYLVWLSEIILQQTRVEQGLPYFEHFAEHYPTIHDLANATEDEVLKNWEGLGYYSRARNLHFTAKYISKELGGVFPVKYSEILSLKGVGPYTAAAIASFCYNLNYAVVDGNVYRLLSRVFGIEDAIDCTKGKQRFSALAQLLLDKQNPGQYNQAIIDFGALQCKPKNPSCADCPLGSICFAKQNKLIDQLPFKSKKINKKLRYFNYLVLNIDGSTLIQKRNAKDIWKGLHEFPCIESDRLLELQEIFAHPKFEEVVGGEHEVVKFSKPFQQVLTHQKITARFIELKLKQTGLDASSTLFLVKKEQLRKFAFPKIIDLYLQDNSLYLELL